MRVHHWAVAIGLASLAGWGMASCAKSSSSDETGLGGLGGTSSSHTGGNGTGGGAGASAGGGVAGEGGSAGGGTAGAGGGGGAGGAACFDVGEPCSECEIVQCPEEYCHCFQSSDCVAVATCLLNCPPNDQACFQACWTANPDGISDAALVQHCGATICSASCAGLVPLSACELCLAQTCESEMNACMAVAACTALLQCVEACTTETCQNDCINANPGGVALATVVFECGNQSCVTECGITG